MTTLAQIKAAAERIAGIAVCTPLLRSPWLDDQTGGTILIKAESRQRTGSFKIRGAYNRLVQLTDAQRARGVVAFSSGNHAQGVACAAQLLGMSATIVMPDDAPALKIANTRSYGARIVLYDRYTQSRETIAAGLAEEQGATLVPSFDDPHIIAGQGTVGLEAAAQAAALGLTPDAAIICCSGGGLASGCAIALQAHFPGCAIVTAEPEHYDDMARSLDSGSRVVLERLPPTLCDALQSPAPGLLTLPLLAQAKATGVSVTDEQVSAAVRDAYHKLGLQLEPGGAAALAAVLSGKVDARGKTLIVIASGENIDPALFEQLIGPDKFTNA
jgi:threonine dehydratase